MRYEFSHVHSPSFYYNVPSMPLDCEDARTPRTKNILMTTCRAAVAAAAQYK